MKPRPPHRPSDAEAIEATAAAWLAQRDDGLSSAQAAEFACWRAADARHEAAVARIEAAWNALQLLRDFRPEARVHPDRDLLRASPSRRVARFPAMAAAAALAASLAVAALGWLATDPRPDHAQTQSFVTTVDGYERLSLEDGSIVELNSASEVRVRYSPHERHVQLVRGEAHFTVAKNPARPFLVEAGAASVRAVGTAFNVRLDAAAVEVLVTEGKVAVAGVDRDSPSAAAGSPVMATRSPRVAPALLRASERVLIPAGRVNASDGEPHTPRIETLAPDALREALAWQGPRLNFVDTPLSDVIAQFNRRNAVQIELADAELGSLPIGGSFRAENVDAFIRLLASGDDVTADRPDSTRIVLRRAK